MSAEVLDALPCGVVSFGDDGRVVRANRTLRTMLRLDDEDLEGRHVDALFTVGTRIFFQTHFFPLLKLHGRAEEVYLALRAGDGEEVGALVNAVRTEAEGGAVVHCVVMRVRERKRFEAELLRARNEAEEALAENRELLAAAAAARAEAEEATEAKSTFLATVSHEIRTPINAILGYTDLLEAGVAGPLTDAQRGYVARVRAGGRHLRTVISDILDLSSAEAGRITVQRQVAPLGEAVEMALSMVEPAADERGLELVASRCSGEDTYLGDPDRVRQIVINVLNNAVKFTPPDGRVSVECGIGEAGDGPGREGEGWPFVRVRDTGPGIGADALESIFEPFVRLDTASEGTGLGLAISRRLARAMGGDLTVASGPGRGSCFTLWLRPASAAGDDDPPP